MLGSRIEVNRSEPPTAAQIRAAAEDLVRHRFLLPEDVPVAVEQALAELKAGADADAPEGRP